MDCKVPALDSAVGRSQSYGVIPPPLNWDVEGHKRDDLYFWLKAVEAVHPGGKVSVAGYGEMLMLGGYSYLGLCDDQRIGEAAQAAIERFGTGSHGSRLLSGTLTLHDQLEQALASFKNTTDAVVFSTGYVANLSTISALVHRHDVVLCDRLSHASILDGGMQAVAPLVRFRHNDAADLDRRLRECPPGARKLVVADAVFSMDGDILDLPAISRVCRGNGAYLMVDECHAVGVLGARGTGIEEHFGLPSDTIDIKMGTLSKSIPSSGGYVAGSAELCVYLRHKARGFIYSGSPTPASVAAALEALRIIRAEPERVEELQRKTAFFKHLLRRAGFDLGLSASPIVPIMVGDADLAALLARRCQEAGLFIQPICPPVVPAGTARLRASVMANHAYADLETAAGTLARCARDLGVLAP